jgi:PhzF family phenazine biosynthesis protein
VRAFPFKKIDAFATATSRGNPAAAVYLEPSDVLSEGEMRRVALELKGFVSEVGFVTRIAADAFKLRYFSSEKEVEFCGHVTIAILHDLVSNDRALAARARIHLHTNKGILPVENRVASEDAVYVHAPAPAFTECRIPLSEICQGLNIPEGSVDSAIEAGIVDAGLQTLCLPLKGLPEVVGAAPDLRTLEAFCQRYRLDIVTVFTSQVADGANRLRSRVFAAPFGYLEDPATGSGNAALGYHLHRCGHWDGTPIRIEQNADIANPNIVRLASLPEPEHGIRVTFGGGAILRIDGRYWL